MCFKSNPNLPKRLYKHANVHHKKCTNRLHRFATYIATPASALRTYDNSYSIHQQHQNVCRPTANIVVTTYHDMHCIAANFEIDGRELSLTALGCSTSVVLLTNSVSTADRQLCRVAWA